MHWLLRLIPVALVLSVTGCQTYQADPLVPLDVLREVELARDLSGTAIESPTEGAEASPDLAQIAQWSLANAPSLKTARAAAAKANALAAIDTPFPNPTLAAGPLFGYDLEPDGGNDLQPFVEFGFTIPLSGRLGYQDDVNELLARVLETELVVEHRSCYLRLRQLYAARALAHRREHVQTAIQESALRSAALTNRLVEAGGASALDVGLMELEVAEGEKDLLTIRAGQAQLTHDLAGLVGVHPRHLGEPPADLVAPLTAELPDLTAAKEILLANHFELAVLRVRYAVAEKQLRLEIARQYPDLEIGSSWEGDPGDTKKVAGLTLGITLPIFDRNQQGIALAQHEREELRVSYESILSQSLAALEGLYAALDLAIRRGRLLEDVILPRAEANVEVAQRAIQAGTLGALEYLVIERQMRALRIEAIEVQEHIQHVIGDIEILAGVPLALLPGEPADVVPDFPTIEAEEVSSSDPLRMEDKQ